MKSGKIVTVMIYRYRELIGEVTFNESQWPFSRPAKGFDTLRNKWVLHF